MKYLFYTDWLDLLFYVAKEKKLDFSQVLKGGEMKKQDLESWQDLKNITQSEDIFADVSEEGADVFLINILDLPFENVEENDSVYLYSTTNSKTLASLKSSAKKTNIEVVDVKKPTEREIEEFIKNEIKESGLKLNNGQINKLIRESNGLTNIKNILDLLALAPTHFDEVFRSQTTTPDLPIFMKKFDLNNFERTIKDWENSVEDGNKDKSLQFVLSIVSGKVIKSGHAKTGEVLKLIAKTDYNFKMGKFDERGSWLVFLNEIEQVMRY